jgi:hypothetical protein
VSQDECIRDLFVSSCLYSNVDTPINLVGGCMLGYIGDKYGRKKALELRLLVVSFRLVLVTCRETHVISCMLL